MRKLVFLASLSMVLPFASKAHDEGHGPKLTDERPNHPGGIVAPVVFLKDATKGASAELQMKSEFVRSEDGTVKFYLYDKASKALDAAKLEKSAKGVVETLKKGKVAKKLNFAMTLENGAYVGKAPKSPSKPFNLYVVVKVDGTEYLAELDNLD